MRNAVYLCLGLVYSGSAIAGLCEKVPLSIGEDQKITMVDCKVDSTEVCFVRDGATSKTKLYGVSNGNDSPVKVLGESENNVVAATGSFCSKGKAIQIPFYDDQSCATYGKVSWSYTVNYQNMSVDYQYSKEYNRAFKKDEKISRSGTCSAYSVDMTETFLKLKNRTMSYDSKIGVLVGVDQARKEVTLTNLKSMVEERVAFDKMRTAKTVDFNATNAEVVARLPDDASVFQGNFHCVNGTDMSGKSGIAEIAFSKSAGAANDLGLQAFARVDVIREYDQSSSLKVLPTAHAQDLVYSTNGGKSSVLITQNSNGVQYHAIKYLKKGSLETIVLPSNKTVCFK